jgi:uncharacterized YigZ family protein
VAEKGRRDTEKGAATQIARESRLIVRYRIPAGEAESELVIKNSVFIGTVGHAPSIEAAQAFIARVRARYPDAHHHAWALKVREGQSGAIGSSDDGEPGGTAGRPMLAVLEGSGLHEIVVVGTRYFGGIKLGTGGLVRAYSGAAREAMHKLRTRECVLHHLGRITIDYGLYSILEYSLPRYGVRVEEALFAEAVTLMLAVPHERAKEVASFLSELSKGQIIMEGNWLGDCYHVVAD